MLEMFVFKLNKTDKKILLALEENGRYSNKKISSLVSLNEHVVAYRIKRFFDSGFLRKICAIVSRGALFPVGYRVYLRFQNLSSENEEKITKRTAENKYVSWAATCTGHWDMIISMFVNDPNHFLVQFNEIIAGFEDNIQEKEIINYLEIIDFNRTYLHGAEPKQMIEYNGKFQKEEIDFVDRKILSELAGNNRQTLIELGKKAGVSPDTIKNRLDKLEKRKIILGTAFFIDYEKIGLNLYVILLNLRNLSPKREKELRNFSLQHPNIIFWIKTIGRYDLNLEIESTETELNEIIYNLRQKFGDVIKNIEVLSTKTSYKYNYFKE